MTESPQDPILSIVMPVRNEGINLRIMLKILRAVVDATHEVLVVYDREGDDSLPVVEAMMPGYPELRLILNKRGVGVLNALSAGIADARGTYVLIFAADEVGPVLRDRRHAGAEGDGCDFVSCTRYARRRPPPRRIVDWRRPFTGGEPLVLPVSGCA